MVDIQAGQCRCGKVPLPFRGDTTTPLTNQLRFCDCSGTFGGGFGKVWEVLLGDCWAGFGAMIGRYLEGC